MLHRSGRIPPHKRKTTSIITQRVFGGLLVLATILGLNSFILDLPHFHLCSVPIMLGIGGGAFMFLRLRWKTALCVFACGVGLGVWMYNNELESQRWKDEQAYIQQYSTIDKVKHNIEGTVWTYTEPTTKEIAVWFRVEFKEGKVYVNEVDASQGDWGKAREYEYTVEERRYSNTGNRYICVVFGDAWKHYMLVPQDRTFYYEGIPMPISDWDSNPWD